MHFKPNVQKNFSHRMGKPTICIDENKGTDQLRSNTGSFVYGFQALKVRLTSSMNCIKAKSLVWSLLIVLEVPHNYMSHKFVDDENKRFIMLLQEDIVLKTKEVLLSAAECLVFY